MKRIIRIMMLLAAMTAAAGEVWARGGGYGKIIYEMGKDGSDGGLLYFYASADDAIAWTNELKGNKLTDNQFVHNLSNVTLTDGKVYILAQADGTHTGLSVTFTAGKSGGSDMAQARRYSADDSGVQMNSIEVSAVSGKPGVYCFEMPADGMNVTISAKFAAKATNAADISYIDADGVTQTKAAGDVYVLDGTEEYLGLYTAKEGIWYVCNSKLDYKHVLWADGDVHLILADGATMSVEVEKGSAFDFFEKALTIYGQSTGKDMGILTAKGKEYGIGASGPGSVTINGGEVTATGKYAIQCVKDVTINGGKVTATAIGEGGYGIFSNIGDITLGWNSATGYIKATNYHSDGSVRTADGKVLKYTDGDSQNVTLMGTLDATTIAAIADKKLTPYGIFGYCGKDDPNTPDADESKNVTWEIPIVDGAMGSTLTISGTGKMADYENTNANTPGNFAPWIKPSGDGKYSDGLKYESVTAVNIGDGVTYIGKNAFDRCRGLKSVTIGEGVNTIGMNAFIGCFGLTTVNIPASVTEIGVDAFYHCFGLTTVTVNRYVSDDKKYPITTLGGDVFDEGNYLKLILVPDEAAYKAYYGSDGKGWGDYKAKLAPQTLTVTKNASGWSTYCHNFPVSYSLSEGATAYKVTGLSEDGKSVSLATADIEPCVPLLLNYVGGEGDVTLTADLTTVTAVEDGDIVSTGEDNCIFSGNTTGSNLTHAADTDDGIPALTGVAGQTSYALYNGNFLRIDTDKGIDGHRCVLTVKGAASPDVIALSTAVVTPGTGGGIGRIVYSEGADDNGKLYFYKNKITIAANNLTPGAALSTNGLEAVKDDNENVVGYRIYVEAVPDEGYTVNGMTLQAELSTSVQQSRRFDSDDTPTLPIGRAIELTPVEGIPYIFTMVMPNDPNLNASVTATFAAKATNTAEIKYIDADGATKEKAVGTVYVLDGTEEVLGLYTAEEGVWYVCNSDLDYKHVLWADGDVHLILANGAKMSVEGEVGIGFEKSLTIYGQSTGEEMGSLTATGDGMYGIGSYATGSVTINGGEVTATGYHGIKAENVTINGGKVTATATGEEGNGIISDGDITLGWNSATGSVTATSYDTYGSVRTADGKMLKYTDDDSQTVKLMGTLDADAIDAIAKMTLTPYGYGGYCGKDNPETDDADESKDVTWEIPLENGATGSTLNISGTGEMADYDENGGPWKELSPVVATIGSGVTTIGANAFAGCDELALILVPDMTAYDDFAQKVSDADKAKLAPNVMIVAKNASGWSTYCHRFPVSYSAEGATAYTVSGLSTSGENVSVTATTGNLVAPAVPLLLGYTGTDDITLTAAPATATTPPADAIVSYSGTGFTYYGNPSGTENLSTDEITDCVYVYPNTAGQQSYVLSEGAFIMVNGTTGGIAPHRCWLNIAGNNAARALTIGGDETTGVKEREANKYSPDIYTLDGRKVNGKPTKKGMYINGDRKVVIK